MAAYRPGRDAGAVWLLDEEAIGNIEVVAAVLPGLPRTTTQRLPNITPACETYSPSRSSLAEQVLSPYRVARKAPSFRAGMNSADTAGAHVVR